MYFCNKITMVTRAPWGAVRVIQREIGLSGDSNGNPVERPGGGDQGKAKTEMKPAIYKMIGSTAKWVRSIRVMTGSDDSYVATALCERRSHKGK